MAERRLIDANALRKKAVPHTRGEHGYSADIRKWAVLVGDIDDAPTIDAVEVVRCKDCKRRYTEDCVMQYTYYSEGYSEDGVSVEWTADADFCSYGERRDSDG